MDLNLTGIRPESVETVRGFADGAVRAFGDQLLSVTLAGSVLTNDWLPGRSDTNFVLVFQRFPPETFDRLVELGRAHGPKGVSAPLCMTQAYLETSLDAFPIEFFNLKLIHHTAHGRDFFSDLAIAKGDLRLQCERELKAHFLQLRNGYLRLGGDARGLSEMLVAAYSAYVPVVRALLFLLGKEPPREAVRAITALEEALGTSMTVLKDIERVKVEEAQLDGDGARRLFFALSELGGELGERVDGMEFPS